jgi:5-methylcytosine-specific restriction protein A
MPKIVTTKDRPWILKRPKNKRQMDNTKFYNSKQWRSTRKHYIKTNPLCEECKRNNRIMAGYCVDHITPISKGGHRTDLSNLQTLCRSCHESKSGKEGIEYRSKIKIRNKPRWG